MKVKINTENLKEFLKENKDGFEKHLVQEGIKSLLIEGEDKTSITMKSYLEDLDLIKIEAKIFLFDKDRKTNPSITDFCKTKVCEDRMWDYKGLSGNADFFGTQRDWNLTLVSLINEVSSKIHDRSLVGGGNTIIVSRNVSHILEDLQYLFNHEYREFEDYVYYGKLANRYDVISLNRANIPNDEIIVLKKEIDIKNATKSEQCLYGKIKVLNTNPTENKNDFSKIVRCYGTEFFVEPQLYRNGLIERTINLGNDFCNEYNLKLIVTTDVIYDKEIIYKIGDEIPFVKSDGFTEQENGDKKIIIDISEKDRIKYNQDFSHNFRCLPIFESIIK